MASDPRIWLRGRDHGVSKRPLDGPNVISLPAMSADPWRPGERRWGTVLAAILVLAAVLRLVGLQSGLWFDEIATLVKSVRLPLSQIVTDFPGVNAHPLYSVLGHLSIETFGESAWSLRLPACLFGVASVGMVFVLGSRVTSRAEALAGAAVLATSYHHIWFSQNARGYTMLGFFALLSTDVLLRARESGRGRDYAIYAIACAAGVYTHLTMVFVVAGQMVAVVAGGWWGTPRLSRRDFTSLAKAWLGAGVLSAIAYAPFVPALRAHLGDEAPRASIRVATGGWAIGAALKSLLSGAGVAAALAGGAVAIAGAVSLVRRAPQVVALLVMPAVVTAVAFLALGQPIRPRFFFFLSGAAAIFVGRGVGAIVAVATRRQTPPVGGVVLVAAVLIAGSAVALPRNYSVPKQDFDGAVRFLEGEESSGARIAAAGPACFPIDAYFEKHTWPCVTSMSELTPLVLAAPRLLVVYTLADYIDDPALRDAVASPAVCPIVRTFPGTLGDGDLIVCDASRKGRP